MCNKNQRRNYINAIFYNTCEYNNIYRYIIAVLFLLIAIFYITLYFLDHIIIYTHMDILQHISMHYIITGKSVFKHRNKITILIEV